MINFTVFLGLTAFVVLALVLVVIDVRRRTLPYRLSLPLLAIGLWLSLSAPWPWWHGWAVAGACWTGWTVIRLAGGRAGIYLGDGDAVVLAAFGAVLGLSVLPVAAVMGIFGVALALIAMARRLRSPLPYSPAIVAPGLIAIGVLVL